MVPGSDTLTHGETGNDLPWRSNQVVEVPGIPKDPGYSRREPGEVLRANVDRWGQRLASGLPIQKDQRFNVMVWALTAAQGQKKDVANATDLTPIAHACEQSA